MGDDLPELTDMGRLLFGAGFVFGVMVTLVVLALVTATGSSDPSTEVLASDAVITIVGGIFFAAIVGVGLYLLAFPANRVDLPVGSLFGDDDGEH
jgi:hypothetical protein